MKINEYIDFLMKSAFFPFVLPVRNWYFTKENFTDSE